MQNVFCKSLNPSPDTILLEFAVIYEQYLFSIHLNFCFIIAQSVSIVFKSGDCAGQYRSLNCFDSKYSFVSFAVCYGLLSC